MEDHIPKRPDRSVLLGRQTSKWCLEDVVFHENNSTNATDYYRTFKLIQPNGETRKVTQLQTKKWQDFSAPDETKLLRDIVHKTRDLSNRDEH